MSSEKNRVSDQQILDKDVNADQEYTETESEITPNDANVERIVVLEAQIEELQKREREAQLRARAEIENVRRRAEQDIEKAHKFGLEKFSAELLPVIDNLERTLEMVSQANGDFTAMVEGVELTLKSLLSVTNKFGIERVEEVNVPFNPEIHEAMAMTESDQHEPNHVTVMMQKGYRLNGRLLRPAMVTVSKAKA